MGSKASIITNEQLSEYAELTYLTKSEIIFILQKFLLLDDGRNFSLTKRFPEQEVVNLFPQLKVRMGNERTEVDNVAYGASFLA